MTIARLFSYIACRGWLYLKECVRADVKDMLKNGSW